MMKLVYARLKNYIGIFQGMGRDEIEITFGNNRITVIRGRNGSGKSTLENALSPYPDEGSCIRSGYVGEKELHYLINNSYIVKIMIDYPITKSGDRSQTKAYIKKQSANGFSELNPTGNITSFKDILEAEFKLDPSFVTLSKISTEDKGIVEKTPSNRKKFVNGITSNVEVYNNINKTLTKRSSVYKSMIVNLNAKIASTGEEEKLRQSKKAIESRIAQINQNIEICTNQIASARAKISLLDPDGSIQSVSNSAKIELDKLEIDEKEARDKIDYILSSNMNGLSKQDAISKEACASLYQSMKNEMYELAAKSENLKKSLNDMLHQREEEYQSLTRLNQQITSLKSEYNFQDLEKTIEVQESNIKKYEEFFQKLNLKKGTTLSKDEYVIGLTALKSIEDMVDSFKSFTTLSAVEIAIDSILQNRNLLNDIANEGNKLKNMKAILDKQTSDYSYNTGLLKRSEILSNRPSNCTINDCPFIMDALEAAQEHPKEVIEKLSKSIEELKEQVRLSESKLDTLKNAFSCTRDIQTVLKNIQMNESIIRKLPVESSVLNKNEFLCKIRNGERFGEIDRLYTFIDYANIFEEYKIAKDVLYKAKTDYSIYENKNHIIDQYIELATSISDKIKGIAEQIEQSNSMINLYDKKILESEDYFRTLNLLTTLYSKLDDIMSEKADCIAKINAASTNMNSIQAQLAIIANCTDQMKYEKGDLQPLTEEIDKIKYCLKMLQEYHAELKQFTESYNELEVYRKYTSPTKEGIQNLYIRVYMNQTRELANQLLGELFDGRLQLCEYIIDADSFAIPCISTTTGMVTDDISRCSRSEKSMISMIIGFVLLRQSSTQYNILKLDEIDEGLDTKNRLMFMTTLQYLMDILEVSQCIIISHTVELDMSNVDVIQLADDDNSISVKEGNIIFEA